MLYGLHLPSLLYRYSDHFYRILRPHHSPEEKLEKSGERLENPQYYMPDTLEPVKDPSGTKRERREKTEVDARDFHNRIGIPGKCFSRNQT